MSRGNGAFGGPRPMMPGGEVILPGADPQRRPVYGLTAEIPAEYHAEFWAHLDKAKTPGASMVGRYELWRWLREVVFPQLEHDWESHVHSIDEDLYHPRVVEITGYTVV